MKGTLTLATILSVAAIAGDVLVAGATSSGGCIFGKYKQNAANVTAGDPSSPLVAKKLDTKKFGIAAAGIAGIAGAIAAGMAYKARRNAQAEPILDEVGAEVAANEVAEAPIVAIAPVEEVVSSSTADRELTAVR